MRSWGRELARLIGVWCALQASTAAADASSCAASHTDGQRAMKAGHLKAALDSFSACGSDQRCPGPVRRECVDLFGSVQSIVPTLVFAVSDHEGHDLTDVKVYSSGELLAQGLDGRPVPVDPGEQGFLFELPSGTFLTADVLVRQGEKNRIVAVRAGPAAAKTPTFASSPANELPKSSAQQGLDLKSMPVGFWVSSGIGVAALGVWGTFALLGRAKEVDLSDCKPRCDPALRGEYDAMRRQYIVADVSLGVGVAAVGAATGILIATRRRRLRSSSERALSQVSRPTLSFAPLLTGRAGGMIALVRAY